MNKKVYKKVYDSDDNSSNITQLNSEGEPTDWSDWRFETSDEESRDGIERHRLNKEYGRCEPIRKEYDQASLAKITAPRRPVWFPCDTDGKRRHQLRIDVCSKCRKSISRQAPFKEGKEIHCKIFLCKMCAIHNIIKHERYNKPKKK